MHADVDANAQRSQVLGDESGVGRRCDVRRVYVVAVLFEKSSNGASAASEPDDGDLALTRRELARRHLNLSVLSAMKAARTPRIQKRTTTCASSQPFTSKWWCNGARLNTRCSCA